MSTGDNISIGSFNGSGNQIGSGGNTQYGIAPTETGQRNARPSSDGPVHLLYGFADIIGWSKLNARLQAQSTGDLVDFLELGMVEASIDPDQVEVQDQGDARFLTFPAGTDPAEVLAKLPRRMDHQLAARNRDMAAHAQLRVRMAFSMGASAPGAAGRVGQAPIAVARLVNSDILRCVMRRAAEVRCGVIIDSYLYEQCVQQRFRADLDPGDWAIAPVSIPEKGFEATGWVRLFGRTGEQSRGLLG
jgi:hypothetical protein